MNLFTSTPLIVVKQDTKEVNENKSSVFRQVTQQLFQNTVIQNDTKKNNNWDSLGGPRFVDFNGLSDAHDSYFDRHKTDNDITGMEFQFLPSTAVESDHFLNTLKNCSISEINESNDQNTTLKISNEEDFKNTVLENSTREIMPIRKSGNNMSGRRRSTIIQPFNFEIREQEKRQRKEARRQYEIVNEQLRARGISATDAFTFKAPPLLHNVGNKHKKQKITKIPSVNVPQQVYKRNYISVATAKPVSQSNTQSELNDINIKMEVQNKGLENTQNITDLHKKMEDVKSNDREEVQKVQPWKKKPFQVTLPKRRIVASRSPKLLTAQRADSRNLYKVRLLEKEKEKLIKLADQKQREKEEIAQLRKQTVHKAMPVPKNQNVPLPMPKRPLANPTNPIFIKRRRQI